MWRCSAWHNPATSQAETVSVAVRKIAGEDVGSAPDVEILERRVERVRLGRLTALVFVPSLFAVAGLTSFEKTGFPLPWILFFFTIVQKRLVPVIPSYLVPSPEWPWTSNCPPCLACRCIFSLILSINIYFDWTTYHLAATTASLTRTSSALSKPARTSCLCRNSLLRMEPVRRAGICGGLCFCGAMKTTR